MFSTLNFLQPLLKNALRLALFTACSRLCIAVSFAAPICLYASMPSAVGKKKKRVSCLARGMYCMCIIVSVSVEHMIVIIQPLRGEKTTTWNSCQTCPKTTYDVSILFIFPISCPEYVILHVTMMSFYTSYISLGNYQSDHVSTLCPFLLWNVPELFNLKWSFHMWYTCMLYGINTRVLFMRINIYT